MKDLVEKNKWLVVYLVVTVVSVLAFAVFVQSQGSDASVLQKAKDAMKKDIETVNKFSTRSVEVSDANLVALEKSLVMAEEDLKSLKSFLSSKFKYTFSEEFKSLGRLKVKQRMIDRVELMKKSLRDGDVYYDKDSKFGFEKYVNGIPATKDALNLETFSGITQSLLKIASKAKLTEVVKVQSKTGIVLDKAEVGHLARYDIEALGTGQSIKAFVEGLKSNKEFFVVIEKLNMQTDESQLNSDNDPELQKNAGQNNSDEADASGVKQASDAFVKAPVLRFDLEVKLYLIEEK